MNRVVLPIVLGLLTSCISSSQSLRPVGGGWRMDSRKEAINKEASAWVRETGPIAIAVAAPFIDPSGTLLLRVWVENKYVDLVKFDTSDALVIEPSGHPCRNIAPTERREMGKIGDEKFAAQFELSEPERVRTQGFTFRFKITPCNPLDEPPIPLEIRFAPGP